MACKKNRIAVVELLLKYGASIEATTEVLGIILCVSLIIADADRRKFHHNVST